MNRAIVLIAVIVLVATGSYLVFAQDRMGGGMMGGGMMGGNMQKRGMRGGSMQNRGMMGMNSMMGPMMHSTSVVATQDGGVVILMGNELLKYDKELNLIKKAEIKFDWENWQKMMMQHRNMMMNRSQQSGSQSSQGE
jgi:hypothetical protein